MLNYNIVHDLVRKTLREKPLPEDINDLDEVARRRIEKQAYAAGSTPQALYAVIRAQQAEDLKDPREDGFDPAAIAKAARRR